jgi:hypothetical protein
MMHLLPTVSVLVFVLGVLVVSTKQVALAKRRSNRRR